MSLSLELKDSIVNSENGVFYFFSGPFNNNIINCDTTNQYFVTGSINITNYTTGTFNIINSYQGGGSGFQGAVGFQGYQGFQGVAGSAGSEGVQGFQGYQGFQGAVGFQGYQGFQGVAGSTGSEGVVGFQGFQGVVGSAGSNGTQGFQGVVGSAGSNGTQGFQGVVGSAGSNGTQGFQGVVGFQGFQGSAGGSSGENLSISSVLNQYIDTTKKINVINLTGAYGSWVSRVSGTSSDIGRGIAVDSSGNSYVTGEYTSPSTIFNSDGTSFLSLSGSGINEVFVARFGSTGMGSWVSRVSGTSSDIGRGIAVDSLGNSYVIGQYALLTTIYNSDGTAFRTMNASGNNEAFIASFGSTGMGVWASRICGTSVDVGNGIAVDSLGNSYVTGHYVSPATIYNSDGTAFRTMSGSGNVDTFIVSYGSTGMGSWVSRVSGISSDSGRGIAVDSLGNSYVIGQYTSPATIYNSDGTAFRTMSGSGSEEAFIVSFGSTGMGSWVSRVSGVLSDIGNGIAVDSLRNSYVTGRYASPATIYNSDGTAFRTMTGSGSDEAFIASFGSTGMGSWVTRVSGVLSDIGNGIAVDSVGNSYVTGQYTGTTTIYNSDGTAYRNISGSGSTEAFIVKFGSTGMASWSSRISGTSTDIGYGIAVDGSGNSYITGQYTSPSTIYNSDETIFRTISGNGSDDAFVLKLNNGPDSVGSIFYLVDLDNIEANNGIMLYLVNNKVNQPGFTLNLQTQSLVTYSTINANKSISLVFFNGSWLLLSQI